MLGAILLIFVNQVLSLTTRLARLVDGMFYA